MRILIAIAFVFLLLYGCCGVTEPQAENTGGPAATPADNHNNAPQVAINVINKTVAEGRIVRFNFSYYDKDADLEIVELRLDGEVFAKGRKTGEFFPEGYAYPEFFVDAMKVRGSHALEIYAIDKNGNTASNSAEFVVVAGPELAGGRWYTCNDIPNPPCDSFSEAYCDKFMPANVNVRTAAAEATTKHGGAYSVNQLLDIYDWMHKNVEYLNVPVDFTYQPFTPTQTLSSKTGDCKNQAVLLASMVESIGGTARVLLIPECSHAFAEVYVGNAQDKDAFNNAVWDHYRDLNVPNRTISWHYTDNKTKIWMPFDTAGGAFPGSTIPACLSAKTVYVIYNCNRSGEFTAPSIENIEYGPFEQFNKKQVIEPNRWWYFNYSKSKQYSFCRYDMTFSSPRKFSWYIIPADSYADFRDGRSYSQYYREEEVLSANYRFDWDSTDKFNLIIYNRDMNMPMTVDAKIMMTCYK